MRRLTATVVAVLSALALPTTGHTTPAPAVTLATLDTSAVASPAPQTWALGIGIDDYIDRDDDLTAAEADIADLDTALANAGVPATQRLTITGPDATVAGVATGLNWLATHAGPEDTIVAIYAGHIDTDGGTRQALRLQDGHLTDTDLDERLDQVPATHQWVILAGCYAGGFTELTQPGRYITAASAANQLSYENTALQNSYLAHGLANAIGSGRTIADTQDHATTTIATTHPNRVPKTVGTDPGAWTL